jgi:hypothetical protein
LIAAHYRGELRPGVLPWRAVDALVDQAPQVDPFFPSSILEGSVCFMFP